MTKYTVSLNNNYTDENNPILQNGDIIRVNKNAVAKVNSTIKNIVEPLVNIVPIYMFLDVLNDTTSKS